MNRSRSSRSCFSVINCYLYYQQSFYILLKAITKTVWILSIVSLLTDMASEMLYPIMPIYLKSVGFSIALIGVLEGFAEATAGLSKGYFGKLSDNIGRRAPFVQVGYTLSAISKPMMALFTFPAWIFSARALDRLGKGLRTAPRDAILSDEATPQTKGKVFGFHRSMDTTGAVLGPALALLYLYFFPGHYKSLFYIAFFPGLAAVLASFYLKDKTTTVINSSKRTSLFSFIRYWKESPATYRRLVTGLLIFALFNSSDLFLLLKAKQAGLSDTRVIGVYIFYNLVFAISAYPVGHLADKLGLKTIFITGLILFAVVYAGMSVNASIYVYFILFFVYGLYAAATEGVSKAWISNITDKKDIGTAIGTFTSFQSICAMIASSVAGFIWYKFGVSVAFLLTALATIAVVIYFVIAVPKPISSTSQ
jgi:MFS family permease